MDNAMEHDECLTDACHSLRQCSVVLEKIDLEKYYLKKKKNSQKAPKMSAEMLKWRRSVIQKRNRLRGYIHTPEEYERRKAYSQMWKKNMTPEQRARINARQAISQMRAREKERQRIQTLSPEDKEQALERIKESNRITNERRLQRKLAMTEEEREAEKAAQRLSYHQNKHKLTDEQRELKNARDRERRKAIRTAIENGQNIHNPYILTDKQRERKNLLRRERRKAIKMLKNRTANEIEEDNTHGREGATENSQ